MNCKLSAEFGHKIKTANTSHYRFPKEIMRAFHSIDPLAIRLGHCDGQKPKGIPACHSPHLPDTTMVYGSQCAKMEWTGKGEFI